MPTVLLARHGETTWNREGRIQGWAPSGLTDRGREQARKLGEHVAAAHDIERIVASDLRRARETAAHVRESVDAGVRHHDGWRERDFGVYQGLTRGELAEFFPRSSEEGANAAVADPERGEDLTDLRERVVGAWKELTADVDGTALVVTHGGPLYVLFGHLRGLDVRESMRTHTQDNCALNEVRIESEPTVVRENDTAHL